MHIKQELAGTFPMEPLTPFPLNAESTASFVLWAKINLEKNIVERCAFYNLLIKFIIRIRVVPIPFVELLFRPLPVEDGGGNENPLRSYPRKTFSIISLDSRAGLDLPSASSEESPPDEYDSSPFSNDGNFSRCLCNDA